MSEAIPNGWQRRSLSSLGEYENGFAFNELHWSEQGLPIVRIAQITGSQGIVDRYPGRLPDTFSIDSGDLIFSWSGTLAVVRWDGGPAWLNQHLFKVVPAANVEKSLLFHLLQASVAEMHKRTHGSTMKHIKRGELREFFVSLPVNAGEQRKLAQILDTLDTAIHETETIIAKLKTVKQGLLHDLLTRGIDANGELRPPQTEAPHLYKKSLLGWIPKEWDVKRLVELLADVDPAMRSGPFGSALLKQEFVEVGVPLLGIDNVQTERFVASFTRFVTPRKFAELVRYAVRPNDLIITIMGTVGRCCLVPEDIGNALSSKHTWTISLNQDAYSPYLAMLQVNYSPWAVAHFASDQQGGTMAAIRSETLRSTLLPAPPREEQYLIEKRLRTLGRRIELEVDSLAKRYSEKAGLMDDLLTGRVSVKKLLLE